MKNNKSTKTLFVVLFMTMVLAIPLFSTLQLSPDAWHVYADSQGYKEMDYVAEGFGAAFGILGALAIACGVQVAVGIAASF